MYLQPCRKLVKRGRARKALRAFLGTCGAAAVMTVALNCQKASDDANRAAERQASPPPTRAPQPTPSPSPVAIVLPTPCPVPTMGIPYMARLEATPTPAAKPKPTALAAAKATAKPAALRAKKPQFD